MFVEFKFFLFAPDAFIDLVFFDFGYSELKFDVDFGNGWCVIAREVGSVVCVYVLDCVEPSLCTQLVVDYVVCRCVWCVVYFCAWASKGDLSVRVFVKVRVADHELMLYSHS